MSTTPSAAQVTEVVKTSPTLVGAHDKAGWLALFASDAVVEDPVGTRPHRRGANLRGPQDEDELGRFYEVFIAPNEVRFEVRADLVVPPFAFRDVLIHTRLPNGYRVEVPAHILYEVCLQDGVPKLRHLAAYWALRSMPTLALKGGLQGLMAVNRQTFRMLRIQRLGGMAGYLRGFRTCGRRGPRLLERLVTKVNAADRESLVELFVDEEPRWELAPGRPLTCDEVIAELGGDPNLAVRDVRAAGLSLSFAFALDGDGGSRQGLGVLELQRRPCRIVRARFFFAR